MDALRFAQNASEIKEKAKMTTIETKTTTRKPATATSRALTWRKTAAGHAIHQGGKALATVEPDAQYAGMWRIRMPDGWVSDLANLTRAREAAIASVLFVLNRQGTAGSSLLAAQTAEGATGVAG